MLKTLGFGDGKILAIVLLESCAIAVIGGAIGLALAWLIIAQGDPTGGMLPIFYFPFATRHPDLVLGSGAGLLPRAGERLKSWMLRRMPSDGTPARQVRTRSARKTELFEEW